MHIILNGQSIHIDAGASLEQCLIMQQIDIAKVVVERNAAIVPAQNFSTTILEDGDILEVLHFVGGG